MFGQHRRMPHPDVETRLALRPADQVRIDHARRAADMNMAVEHPGQVFLRFVAALMRRPASRMPSRAELGHAALGIILRLVTGWIGLFLR